MNSNKKTATTIALLYLLMAVFSAFGLLYIESNYYVKGDAAATVQKIRAGEGLFRLGFVSMLVGQVIFIFLVDALYKLFAPVHKGKARMMLILVVVSVPITMLNQLFQLAPVYLLSGEKHLAGFSAGQIEGLVVFMLDMQKHGVYIAEIFWGLWLIPFGSLVAKSGYFPKWLGTLIIVGGVAYIVECMFVFLLPEYAEEAGYPVAISALAEIGFIAWLLIVGIKRPEGVEVGRES